jgi:hypothetical protein
VACGAGDGPTYGPGLDQAGDGGVGGCGRGVVEQGEIGGPGENLHLAEHVAAMSGSANPARVSVVCARRSAALTRRVRCVPRAAGLRRDLEPAPGPGIEGHRRAEQ